MVKRTLQSPDQTPLLQRSLSCPCVHPDVSLLASSVPCRCLPQPVLHTAYFTMPFHLVSSRMATLQLRKHSYVNKLGVSRGMEYGEIQVSSIPLTANTEERWSV